MGSPEASRRVSGEATPPTVHLELGPDPEQGARVWVVHDQPTPVPSVGPAVVPALDPTMFEPVPDGEPTPVADEAGLAGAHAVTRPAGPPLVPEEILAASGAPGEPRPTPTMDTLDWVRVFGPLGAEDRDEDEPDGPAWLDGPGDPAPELPARPPGQTANAGELSLSELIDSLVPPGSSSAPRPRRSPRRRRGRARPVGRFAREGRGKWLSTAAVLVVAAPAAGALTVQAVDNHGGADRARSGHLDDGTPTGTTTPPVAR